MEKRINKLIFRLMIVGLLSFAPVSADNTMTKWQQDMESSTENDFKISDALANNPGLLLGGAAVMFGAIEIADIYKKLNALKIAQRELGELAVEKFVAYKQIILSLKNNMTVSLEDKEAMYKTLLELQERFEAIKKYFLKNIMNSYYKPIYQYWYDVDTFQSRIEFFLNETIGLIGYMEQEVLA